MVVIRAWELDGDKQPRPERGANDEVQEQARPPGGSDEAGPRVLHVAEAFGGGLLQMIVQVAEGQAAAGDAVCIAYGLRPETPEDVRGAVDADVELAQMPWTSRRPGCQVAAAARLRALIKEWRPDVVHLHSSFAGAVGAAVVPASIPTIFTPNAFASQLPEGRRAVRAVYAVLERWVCRRVTLVGAVSESEAELAEHFGARQVLMIRNGVADPDISASPAEDAGRPVGRPSVVAAGRTVPQRCPEAAGRILSQLRDVADVAWLGGGGGSRGVDGAAALNRLGIPMTGWLERDDALRRVGSSAAYLHWTAWDGMPMSVLEAVALGVPVVASDIAPNRDALGDAGICATEDEAVAMLRRIVKDPTFAEDLRTRQQVRREDFREGVMVDRWRGVYRSLAASGGTGIELVPLDATCAQAA